MSDWLSIELYPDDEVQAGEIDQLIQETLAEEGVRGTVSVCWVMPDALAAFGISQLPAVVIDDEVVLQGRPPTRADIVTWFDSLVPIEERAPKRRPDRTGWPASLDEAVTWLIDGMRESERWAVAAADDEQLGLANAGGLPGSWGQGIRNGFGLWAGNRLLLEDCGTTDAEEASLIIMRAVRDRLKRPIGR
jgi:hypothetical protein